MTAPMRQKKMGKNLCSLPSPSVPCSLPGAAEEGSWLWFFSSPRETGEKLNCHKSDLLNFMVLIFSLIYRCLGPGDRCRYVP